MKERRWWMLFILAAILIVVALTIHMFIMHMDSFLGLLGISVGNPLEWQSTLARSRNISMMVMLGILLAAALFHGLYGLRGILIEWIRPRGAQVAITWLIALFGLSAFAWGLVVLFGAARIGG